MLDRLVNALKVTLWGGLSLFWFAPLIPLIAIVPEMAQHVAEIQLGMFDSKEAFAAQADSGERWFYAYFKIAGLFLAILAAARFIGGAGQRWWDLRTVAWRPFLFALLLNVAATLGGLAITNAFAGEVPLVLNYSYQIATLPLLIYLVGPLWGDRSMTLRRAYTEGWLAVILAGGLSLLAWVPAQWLHQANHTWAMGQNDMVVWALMIWDSLLVGMMAVWMGAALAVGYWLGRPPVSPGVRNEPDGSAGMPA